jgi:hypothetical protein
MNGVTEGTTKHTKYTKGKLPGRGAGLLQAGCPDPAVTTLDAAHASPGEGTRPTPKPVPAAPLRECWSE